MTISKKFLIVLSSLNSSHDNFGASSDDLEVEWLTDASVYKPCFIALVTDFFVRKCDCHRRPKLFRIGAFRIKLFPDFFFFFNRNTIEFKYYLLGATKFKFFKFNLYYRYSKCVVRVVINCESDFIDIISV